MPPQSWGRQRHFGYNAGRGSVAEWFKAPVLKTGDGQPSVSSNLTASARSSTPIYPNQSDSIGETPIRQGSPSFLTKTISRNRLSLMRINRKVFGGLVGG